MWDYGKNIFQWEYGKNQQKMVKRKKAKGEDGENYDGKKKRDCNNAYQS